MRIARFHYFHKANTDEKLPGPDPQLRNAHKDLAQFMITSANMERSFPDVLAVIYTQSPCTSSPQCCTFKFILILHMIQCFKVFKLGNWSRLHFLIHENYFHKILVKANLQNSIPQNFGPYDIYCSISVHAGLLLY